jgi:hypothetical protein
METADRKAKQELQTQEIYAAIGRFVVQFEHVVHGMQETVASLLRRNGLAHAGLSNAVLAGLHSGETLRAFRAAVIEVRKDDLDPADRKIFEKAATRIGKLIETRNDIVHRMWYVGWSAPEDEDFSTVAGAKHNNTKKGSEFEPRHYTKDDWIRDDLRDHRGACRAAAGRKPRATDVTCCGTEPYASVMGRELSSASCVRYLPAPAAHSIIRAMATATALRESSMDTPLKREFEYYLAHQAELVEKYNGQVIAIKNASVLGAYPDEVTAVAETQKTHRLGSFLVQKVEPGDSAYTQTFHSRVALA